MSGIGFLEAATFTLTPLGRFVSFTFTLKDTGREQHEYSEESALRVGWNNG